MGLGHEAEETVSRRKKALSLGALLVLGTVWQTHGGSMGTPALAQLFWGHFVSTMLCTVILGMLALLLLGALWFAQLWGTLLGTSTF